MGNGIQGLFGFYRQLHELAGGHTHSISKVVELSLTVVRLSLQLANTEEMQDGESKGSLGEVFIR
jgi:hypothetical protein